MVELLTTFSLPQIILCLVIVLLSVQEGIKLLDFLYEKFKRVVLHKESVNKVNIESLATTVDLLVASDRDDIRSWIIEKYHYYKKYPQELDDYMMDCIYKRYDCYKKEGGNSYIDEVIEKIKKLKED